MVPTYLTPLSGIPAELQRQDQPVRAATPGPIESAAEHVGPATPTESVVAGLYGEVLHRDQVGVTDSFFDLGGSSLAVMRLVDLIGRQTGVDVGITTVFLHPTARQLAASIDAISSGSAADRADDPIVVLSDGIGDLPLFLIHAVGGTVAAYADLAGELAGTFHVHGLQAPALTGRTSPTRPARRVPMRTWRNWSATTPAGSAPRSRPDRTGWAGWSMGGVVAFEVARRLEQAGQQVAMLVLLDAPFAVPADASARRSDSSPRSSSSTRPAAWAGTTRSCPTPRHRPPRSSSTGSPPSSATPVSRTATAAEAPVSPAPSAGRPTITPGRPTAPATVTRLATTR